MKIVSVVGARPQFVKLAPVCRAMQKLGPGAKSGIDNFILHTGQHYDPEMSDVFFTELDIPPADLDLGVGSGSHGHQTARMLAGIEDLLLDRRPDLVLVYGDTNSTVAASLAAVKLGIPSAHVEAGLRSGDRRMPEETNRVVADHLAALNLAPTATAVRNLDREGLADRTLLTGDVMLDAVLHHRELARQRRVYDRLGLTAGRYGVATLHRAENTVPARLGPILEALNSVAEGVAEIVFPVHPRTRAQIAAHFGGFAAHRNLKLIEPLGYLDMIDLLSHARLALTDSGGLQKEAFFLEVPCVTMRDTTEWLETVEAGANIIAGADPRRIVEAARSCAGGAAASVDFAGAVAQSFGDGRASDRIVEALLSFDLGGQRS